MSMSIKSSLLLSIALLVCGRERHARADAPEGRYVITDTTVKDRQTKLTWQRVVDSQPRSLDNAKQYCQNLPLEGGGWRLPGLKELLSLVDPTRWNPAIDVLAFPDTPAGLFWSSTPNADTEYDLHAWSVDFYDGTTTLSREAYDDLAVRCVR